MGFPTSRHFFGSIPTPLRPDNLTTQTAFNWIVVLAKGRQLSARAEGSHIFKKYWQMKLQTKQRLWRTRPARRSSRRRGSLSGECDRFYPYGPNCQRLRDGWEYQKAVQDARHGRGTSREALCLRSEYGRCRIQRWAMRTRRSLGSKGDIAIVQRECPLSGWIPDSTRCAAVRASPT